MAAGTCDLGFVGALARSRSSPRPRARAPLVRARGSGAGGSSSTEKTQRQFHAHAARFGGEEGGDQPVHILDRDSEAAVLHRRHDVPCVVLVRSDQQFARTVGDALHRFDRMGCQGPSIRQDVRCRAAARGKPDQWAIVTGRVPGAWVQRKRRPGPMLTGSSRGRSAHTGTRDLGPCGQPRNVLEFERALRQWLRMGCEAHRASLR
jgi:hypothetical protein